MAENNYTLTTFYKQWDEYQQHIKEAVVGLSAEQLELGTGKPGLRPIGWNAAHIIGCRVGWFTYTLHEDGSAYLDTNKNWDEAVQSGSDLAQGLDASWRLMADCLARWSSADMEQTFPDEWEDGIHHLSRAWIVWHVMEHDLHHGGEISLMLGMHGLPSNFTS